MRARRSAVAGATTMRSAERDSSIWPISASSTRLKRSSRAGAPAERRGGHRRDELLGGGGHDDLHLGAALAEPADQSSDL